MPFDGPSRRLGLVALVVVAAIVSGTVSAGASVRTAGHLTDPRGDNGSAGDIIAVDASDSNGVISVDVGFEPSQVLPPGDSIQLEFDIDRNPSTGDQAGGDYGLVLFCVPGPNPLAFAFFKLSRSAPRRFTSTRSWGTTRPGTSR